MADTKVFRTMRVGDPSLNIVGTEKIKILLDTSSVVITVDGLKAMEILCQEGCVVDLKHHSCDIIVNGA